MSMWALISALLGLGSGVMFGNGLTLQFETRGLPRLSRIVPPTVGFVACAMAAALSFFAT